VLHVVRADHLDAVGHYALTGARGGDRLPKGTGLTRAAFDALRDTVAATTARRRAPRSTR